jgi:hypothetical protein
LADHPNPAPQAYDQHLNMILGEVEETVTTYEIDDETYEEIIKVCIFRCDSVLAARQRLSTAWRLGAGLVQTPCSAAHATHLFGPSARPCLRSGDLGPLLADRPITCKPTLPSFVCCRRKSVWCPSCSCVEMA